VFFAAIFIPVPNNFLHKEIDNMLTRLVRATTAISKGRSTFASVSDVVIFDLFLNKSLLF